MRALLGPATLALLLAVAACSTAPDDQPSGSPSGSGSAGPQAQVGDVVPHQLGSQVEGQHAYVVVPGRRYDFLVSSPQPAMDAASAQEAGLAPEPADGAAVVEVSWKLGPAEGDWSPAVAEDDPDLPFALVVGDDAYDLGELDDDGPTAAYVVVPEDTDDIDVRVTFDGLSQQVEVLGPDPVDQPVDAPPGLYGGGPRLLPWDKQPALADDPRGRSLTGGMVSTRVLSPTPYVTGLGWAPEGRAWVLVDVAANGAVSAVQADGEQVPYAVAGGEAVIRLSGRKPDRLLPLGSPRAEEDVVGQSPERLLGKDDVWRGQAVFLVPDDLGGGDLTVRRPLFVDPLDPEQAELLGTPANLDQELQYRRDLVF
jgi:hypothetical protein